MYRALNFSQAVTQRPEINVVISWQVEKTHQYCRRILYIQGDIGMKMPRHRLRKHHRSGMDCLHIHQNLHVNKETICRNARQCNVQNVMHIYKHFLYTHNLTEPN